MTTPAPAATSSGCTIKCGTQIDKRMWNTADGVHHVKSTWTPSGFSRWSFGLAGSNDSVDTIALQPMEAQLQPLVGGQVKAETPSAKARWYLGSSCFGRPKLKLHRLKRDGIYAGFTRPGSF